MKKEVSAAEMQALHAFCMRHFVKHYDVRLELTDHLATSIEAIWAQDEAVPFEKALDQVYSRYGAIGFRKLMAEKERLVEASFHKGVKQMFVSLFRWPDAVITATLVLSCLYVFTFYYRGNNTVPVYFLYSFCVAGLLFNLFQIFRLNQRQRRAFEPLLCTQLYFGFSFNYLVCYFLLMRVSDPLLGNQELLYSPHSRILFVVYSLLCIISILISIARYRYGRYLFDQAEHRYPEAFRPVSA